MKNLEVKKSAAWSKLYLVLETEMLPETHIKAIEGGYYIFDDCGELEQVDEEAYLEYNAKQRNVEYRLTAKYTQVVYAGLESVMCLFPFNKTPKLICVIEDGIHWMDHRRRLHSFKITSIMKWEDFVRYVSNELLDEFAQLAAAESDTKRAHPASLTSAYEYWLNEFYFPMKAADKHKNNPAE